MNLKSTIFLQLIAVLFLVSCEPEEPIVTEEEFLDIRLRAAVKNATNGRGLDYFAFPTENDLASIPQDPRNPLTTDKVLLGQMLYHETGLAIHPVNATSIETYSCASCHSAAAGFQAGRIQGIGEGGIGFGIAGENRILNPIYSSDSIDVQPIRTPTALNGAYQELMLWNGQFGSTGDNIGTQQQWTAGTPKAVNNLGYQGLEIQAIAGLTVHRMGIDTSFIFNSDYKEMFDRVFSGKSVQTRYTVETAGLAIAAYERSLLANDAPFQQWLNGNATALTDQEKEGAVLFFGKANCVSCHTGPALNEMEFHALGMNDLDGPEVFGTSPTSEANLGRGGFTQQSVDMYKFKVPQLYNLINSPFYGHGGNFTSIRDVIVYKNNGVAQNGTVPNGQLASDFKPLGLTEAEITALTEFIENGLYDPNLMRYEPTHIPSGNCFPNNDSQSQMDLGCN